MTVKSKQVVKPVTAKRATAAPAKINRVRGIAGNHTRIREQSINERYRKADVTTQKLERGENKEQPLQLKASHESAPLTVPPIVHEVLRSPGRPLDAATRAFMEPRFGHDFSDVRVHTGADAGEAASTIDADAFTARHNIAFATGKYTPQSESGRRLLFHELTHVVQQRAGVQLKNEISQPGDSYEKQAEAVANELGQGRSGEIALGEHSRIVSVDKLANYRPHMSVHTVQAIQRQTAYPKDESLPEKSQMLLDDIYEREMVEYPNLMRDNLQDWIEAMNFPADAVNKPIADQVVDAFNKNLGKLLIGKVIDAVPNPILQQVLKFANGVIQDVVSQTVAASKDYSNLRRFWSSLSDTYNTMAIIGGKHRPKYKENTIDFKNSMATLGAAQQNKIHQSLQRQVDDISGLYDAEIGKAFLYFASLYLNSMDITPPASEKITKNGAKKGFIIINYNVDSSPGVLGEKDGKYKFFPNPTYVSQVKSQGYRFIDNNEILSVFPKLGLNSVADIWLDLIRYEKRRTFTATLIAPLADRVKETLYDHAGGDVLDTSKLSIRRRVMLNYYAPNKDFDKDGKQISERLTSNYDEFYWKVMWKMEGFPPIRKDRLYAQEA